MNTTTMTLPIAIDFQVADDLETAHSRIAHKWYAGLGLEYAGVDLGDGMTYDVLRVIGRLLVRDRNTGVSEDPAGAISGGTTEP